LTLFDEDRRQPRRALVIGLSVIEARALRAALRTEGFGEVFQAEDAATAAAILASELVDVVFTPAARPGITPREVFSLLRGRGPNRQAPVVLVGTRLAQPDIVSAVKAGAAGVLTLPALKEALRDLLAKLFASAPAKPAEPGVPPAPRTLAPRQRRNGTMP